MAVYRSLKKLIEEDKPLGTAGSLGLIGKQLSRSFIVTNCDVIIDTDYGDLYRFHEEGEYAITLVASLKNYTIPYGTCELNDDGSLDVTYDTSSPIYGFQFNISDVSITGASGGDAETAGVMVLEGVCFYVMAPHELAERFGYRTLVTDSAKLANIIPGYGYSPILRPTSVCVDASISGTIPW